MVGAVHSVSAPLQSYQLLISSLHNFSGLWAAGAPENVVIEDGSVGGLTGQSGSQGPGHCREDVQGCVGPGPSIPSVGAWWILMLNTRIKNVKYQN